MNSLFVLQLISCAMLTGLIWMVQVVHYPSFRYILDDQFQFFHRHHTKSITAIVLPMMVTELLTGFAIAILSPDFYLLWINFIGILLIWLITFFVSVPLHNQLSKVRNLMVIERLVLTNWTRTLLWTLRLSLLLYIFLKTLEVGNGNFGD